jgi:hypothetical protein
LASSYFYFGWGSGRRSSKTICRNSQSALSNGVSWHVGLGYFEFPKECPVHPVPRGTKDRNRNKKCLSITRNPFLLVGVPAHTVTPEKAVHLFAKPYRFPGQTPSTTGAMAFKTKASDRFKNSSLAHDQKPLFLSSRNDIIHPSEDRIMKGEGVSLKFNPTYKHLTLLKGSGVQIPACLPHEIKGFRFAAGPLLFTRVTHEQQNG